MKPFKCLKFDWLYQPFASAQFHSRVGPDLLLWALIISNP